MSMRKTALQRAIEKRDTAKAKFEAELYTRKLGRIKAQYHATETTKQRRQPTIETKNEEGILDARKRLLAHNLGRDLERNYAAARAIIHQFRINVVGDKAKIQVNVDGGKEAADWFNQVWAKDCDYRDDVHFSTQCQNVVAACIREGDVLAVFDDGVADNSGKLLHWESDQIVGIDGEGIKGWSQYADGMTEDMGIVRDKYSRIIAYVVTGKRGGTKYPISDVTIFPRTTARLVKNPWRLNQGRGIGLMLTAATNFQDLYEMLVKELQTAKRAASQYGFVKRTDATMDYDAPGTLSEYLPENAGKSADTVETESAGGGNSENLNYERLESYLGGMIDYIDAKDDVQIPNIDRPNIHLPEFCEAILGTAGASMGMAHAYTVLKAHTSYTAFRGDMIMTWATFYVLQKWLERSYADWVGIKALTWAQREGHIKKLPKGWERKLSWTWPRMPSVDQLKEENAIRQALKNGTTNYADLLGPEWFNILNSYSEQINRIRELKLPLGILETNGDEASQETGNNTGDDNNE